MTKFRECTGDALASRMVRTQVSLQTFQGGLEPFDALVHSSEPKSALAFACETEQGVWMLTAAQFTEALPGRTEVGLALGRLVQLQEHFAELEFGGQDLRMVSREGLSLDFEGEAEQLSGFLQLAGPQQLVLDGNLQL